MPRSVAPLGSSDFPTAAPLQGAIAGGDDLFIARIGCLVEPAPVENTLLMVRELGDIRLTWVNTAGAAEYWLYERFTKTPPASSPALAGWDGAIGLLFAMPTEPFVLYDLSAVNCCGESGR